MSSLKDNIIELLIKEGHLNKPQLEHALDLQKQKGMPLRKILVDEGLIQE